MKKLKKKLLPHFPNWDFKYQETELYHYLLLTPKRAHVLHDSEIKQIRGNSIGMCDGWFIQIVKQKLEITFYKSK